MIKKVDFSRLQQQLKKADKIYQEDVAVSRSIVMMSKQCIYAAMRGDIKAAASTKQKMEKKIKLIKSNLQRQIAEQEFTEAVCFLSFVKNKEIKSFTQLAVEPENYLLGICDLFGELSRYAVNAAIKKDIVAVEQTKEAMHMLYGELLQFDFKNGMLRRKFDSTKYEVAKIERLLLEQMKN